MTWALIAFGLVGFGCVVAVIAGLPGAWMLLALAALLEGVDHLLLDLPGHTTFGWGWIFAGVLAAGLGELIELGSGMLGAKGGGGSKRGMVGSIAGGLIGALVLTPFLPIIGTLFGAILGTFVGAWIGETTGQDASSSKEALKPALTATIARVVGTVAKGGIAMVLWVGLLVVAIV